MQPTRAQVVPWAPPSMSNAVAPADVAARYAASPAVPAPMMATSACTISHVGFSFMNCCRKRIALVNEETAGGYPPAAFPIPRLA